MADTGKLKRIRRAVRHQPGGGLSFPVPPDLGPRERRKIRQLIDAQLAEIKNEPKREAHLHRWRFQLVPLCWLAGAVAGLACPVIGTAIAAALAMVITTAATRNRNPFPRMHTQGMSAWAGCWAIILAAFGLGPWAALGLLGWAVASGFWLEHYRWKKPAAASAPVINEIEDIWNELCAEQKWFAGLGKAIQIPSGARYPIRTRGTKTNIRQIAGKRDEVAAAFYSSITTAFAEPHTNGILTQGWLTILRESTLDTPRPWNRAGIDLATGLALVGRFPEGGPVSQRYFVPGVGGGAKHTIVAGCDGSGKTGFLDMNMCISIGSGRIAPVILDPQMGQAMPVWQEVVPYACGTDQCMAWLRGLYNAMMARSEYLAQLRWQHPRTGRWRKGMGFFDYDIVAAARAAQGLPPLPFIEIVIDEAPLLLAIKGASQLLLDILKLGRKVGFRVVLAAQVPSIAELGKGELRSILVGGNVFCFRVGDKVSSGMMNIPAKPNELPKTFADGSPTVGLGYASTVESRPGVTMRSDWMDEEALYDYAEQCQVRAFDTLVAERVGRSQELDAQRLAGLRQAGDDVATSQLQVLAALDRPMPMGHLIVGCAELSPSQVVNAAAELEKAGKIRSRGGMVELV